MDIVWEDHQLRQQMLNQFGSSTGMCFQFYHFGEKIFCFSDNINELTSAISTDSCSLKQWYQAIYEADRHRLQQYAKYISQKSEEHYTFNYRLRDHRGQLIWVSSKGNCIFDKQGKPKYFLGVLSASNGQQNDVKHDWQTRLLQKLKKVHSQGQEGYLLMVDVDNLSQINLKYGRGFGDGILQNLKDAMKETDSHFLSPFRIGHSSFCTLATDVDKEAVETYFRTLQQHMHAQCTLSGGCVSLQEYQVPDSDLLIRYAESAMDAAKLLGKTSWFSLTPKIMNASWPPWSCRWIWRRQ